MMHYYKRNIGDYAKKAGRLSMLEHGAYTLLIDACYDRESFPTEREAIEWTWARGDDEVEAVKFVLSRFFTLADDGTYVQNRIKDELDAYHAMAETNKRIAKEREEKRRKKKLGNNAPSKDDNAPSRIVDNASRSVHEAPPNQEPLTINQEPLTNNQNINTHTQAENSLSAPEQIRQTQAQSLVDWPVPDLDTMRGELFRAGVNIQLTQAQYETHCKDFKAHYEQRALLGQPLNTDAIRFSKLRQWIDNAANRPNRNASSKAPTKPDGLAVNDYWGQKELSEDEAAAYRASFETYDGQAWSENV